MPHENRSIVVYAIERLHLLPRKGGCVPCRSRLFTPNYNAFLLADAIDCDLRVYFKSGRVVMLRMAKHLLVG